MPAVRDTDRAGHGGDRGRGWTRAGLHPARAGSARRARVGGPSQKRCDAGTLEPGGGGQLVGGWLDAAVHPGAARRGGPDGRCLRCDRFLCRLGGVSGGRHHAVGGIARTGSASAVPFLPDRAAGDADAPAKGAGGPEGASGLPQYRRGGLHRDEARRAGTGGGVFPPVVGPLGGRDRARARGADAERGRGRHDVPL